MHLTKAEAKAITGAEPRKVHYCLWNDAESTRDAVEWLHVVECDDEEDAKRHVNGYYKAGREHFYNEKCLYSYLQHEYYQKTGDFVPTVFVYRSSKFSNSLFGYFVTRWTLEERKSHLRDLRGKLNCNFYSIYELDTDRDQKHDHLCSDVEKIWGKYKPLTEA